MDYTLIHENKLKVILTAGEMQDLGLENDHMDYNDPVTRLALVSVLELSRTKARFNPRGARLFVEAYPCENGGCVLYFTCLHISGDGKPRVVPVVFEFEGPDELCSGAQHVHDRYAHRIHRSVLYRFGSCYRLIVYPLDYSDRLSVYFLSEYGRKIGDGELLAAYTAEHGEEIIAEDAIGILSEHFFRPPDG